MLVVNNPPICFCLRMPQVVRARVTSVDGMGRPRCSLKLGKGVTAQGEAEGEGEAMNGGAAEGGSVLQVCVQ